MTGMIPLNDLNRLHAPIQNELDDAVARVLKSGRYIGGKEVTGFEAELADYLDVSREQVVSCSSGTDALLMALMALGVGPGDRVAVPTFTFASPAMSIVRLGATPVFIDIDPDTYNIDVQHLHRQTDLKGVIPVHLFGQAAAIESIVALANDRGWFVIEDAAQAIGTTSDGKHVATFGDVGCFSFFPTKNLGAIGDAGACVARDADLANALRQIRHHGSTIKYQHDRIGGNFRMDAIQAAVLSVKLPHLDAWNRRRRDIASMYLGKTAPVGHTFHRFVVEREDRDSDRVTMSESGIETGVYYPQVLHEMNAFRTHAETPHAIRASQHLLAVPLFPSMTDEEINRVSMWLD